MSDFEKLINASDLIEWIMEAFPDWCVGPVRSIVDYVEALPSVQPERKVGKWIEVENKWGGLEIRCSECGAKVPRDEWGNAMQSAYCHNCGARMV